MREGIGETVVGRLLTSEAAEDQTAVDAMHGRKTLVVQAQHTAGIVSGPGPWWGMIARVDEMT